MRVTQRMLSNKLQFALQKNLDGISKVQEQISLGTKVNRPSDDPAGFSNTLALQSNLNLNQQYQRNITDGLGWLSQTDAGLEKATQALHKARELTIQGATGTMTDAEMRAIGRQIDAMTDELLEAANTSLGGKYIFAGLNNTTEPFHRSGDDFTFSGDSSEVLREIAPGARYPVNINGERLFYDKVVEIARGSGSSVEQVKVDGLQFGEYKVSTSVVDADAASNSTAWVDSCYTQAKNTIISNVSVSDPANQYNSSILMEVTDINYTSDYIITDTKVKFTYRQLDKATGSVTTGEVYHTFTDGDGDGDPELPPSITVGDVALNIDLTQFITSGDKAVISVAAQSNAGDLKVGVNYDSSDMNWVFSNTVSDPGKELKFFTLDEGDGESFDGQIGITFNGGFSASPAAATFTSGNLFDAMVYLRRKLDNNEPEKVDRCLGYLDEKTGWLLQERVRAGARLNHLESVDYQYQNLEVSISDMLKDYYSTDVAKATVRLGEKQLTYQASLSAGARIMQISLLDYLR